MYVVSYYVERLSSKTVRGCLEELKYSGSVQKLSIDLERKHDGIFDGLEYP